MQTRLAVMQAPCRAAPCNLVFQLFLFVSCFCHWSQPQPDVIQTESERDSPDSNPNLAKRHHLHLKESSATKLSWILDHDLANLDGEYGPLELNSLTLNNTLEDFTNATQAEIQDNQEFAKDSTQEDAMRQKIERMKRTTYSQFDFVTPKKQALLSPRSVFSLGPGDLHRKPPARRPRVQTDYMLRVFDCFANSSCPHPYATTVQSFPNRFDTARYSRTATLGNQMCRLFRFEFALGAPVVPLDVVVTRAELRLYVTSGERRGNAAARVSLLQNRGQLENSFKFSTDSWSPLSQSVIGHGQQDRWITFNVTELVAENMGSDQRVVSVEACLENTHQGGVFSRFNIESKKPGYSPVLVVYSSERKKRKPRAFKNKLDRIAEEIIMDHFRSSKDKGNPAAGRHGDRDADKKGKSRESMTSSREQSRQRRRKAKMFRHRRTLRALGSTIAGIQHKSTSPVHTVTTARHDNRPRPTPAVRPGGLDRLLGDDPLALTRITVDEKRKKSGRKRPRKKGPCSMSPMYVDFSEIGWNSWIIAPEGYNAFECTGRCRYPLNQGSPTKHAIIQTLVHTNWPERASRACCVPTQLKPISILYVDENDVVTYKYQYADMVVAECGCR